MKPIVKLYSDGGYSKNKNIGGYAFIVQYLKWNKETNEFQGDLRINIFWPIIYSLKY